MNSNLFINFLERFNIYYIEQINTDIFPKVCFNVFYAPNVRLIKIEIKL